MSKLTDKEIDDAEEAMLEFTNEIEDWHVCCKVIEALKESYRDSETITENLLIKTRIETAALKDLTPNWNSYGGLVPSAESIKAALYWLISSYSECLDADVHWHKPNVTASAEGDVVFEWWAKDKTLSVYVNSKEARFHQSWDTLEVKHVHGEATLDEKLAELMRWFGE